jgi:hypothetical protein
MLDHQTQTLALVRRLVDPLDSWVYVKQLPKEVPHAPHAYKLVIQSCTKRIFPLRLPKEAARQISKPLSKPFLWLIYRGRWPSTIRRQSG